jgi:hypothetical protein
LPNVATSQFQKAPLVSDLAALALAVGGALALLGCDCSVATSSHGESRAAPTREVIVFEGACDASGAVPIDDQTFAVADDENDVLRIYSVRGGPPIDVVDIGDEIGTNHVAKGKKKKKKPRRQESDIEAGTLLNGRGYWLTSHARTKGGKHDPDRFRFFATEIEANGLQGNLYGSPYHGLLEDLLADPRLQELDLVSASHQPSKTPEGLNIEGMTATSDGKLLLGFRGPRPLGRALLVPIENPEDVMSGEHARLGRPVLLSLDGRGVRGLSYWRGRTLVLAGAHDSSGISALYSWDGVNEPVLEATDFADLNPEAFFTPDTGDEILVLSDDGDRELHGQPCKRAESDAGKRFRGVRLRLSLGSASPPTVPATAATLEAVSVTSDPAAAASVTASEPAAAPKASSTLGPSPTAAESHGASARTSEPE